MIRAQSVEQIRRLGMEVLRSEHAKCGTFEGGAASDGPLKEPTWLGPIARVFAGAWPRKYLVELSDRIQELAGECPIFTGTTGDLGGDKEAEVAQHLSMWITAYEGLRLAGLDLDAEQLLVKWWSAPAAAQLTRCPDGGHIYRARAAHELGKLKLEQGERHAAFKWFVLALVDDCLNDIGHESSKVIRDEDRVADYGSASYLQRHFAMSWETLGTWRQKVYAGPRNLCAEFFWSGLLESSAITTVAACSSPADPIMPISPAVACGIAGGLAKSTESASQEERNDGKDFEHLCRFLFHHLNGAVLRSFSTTDGAGQVDLLVELVGDGSRALRSLAGGTILVECKDTAGAVPAHEVAAAVVKALAVRSDSVLIVSREGLTSGGPTQHRAGSALARRMIPLMPVASLRVSWTDQSERLLFTPEGAAKANTVSSASFLEALTGAFQNAKVW